MADHFYNVDDEPILDETLDNARGWLKEFARSHGVDLESHYSAWNLRWVDNLGNDRSVQLGAEDKPYVGLGVYPHSWFDEEYAPEAERRHAHQARSFRLISPFSRQLFDETLDLAVRDADSTDPLHSPAYRSQLTWTPGIQVYRKPRPIR